MTTKKGVSKSKRKKMSGQREPSITSDWVKTIIAIVVQSIAVGFYLAGVKSDLGHLTEDFKEFKIQIVSDVSGIKASSSSKLENFEKEISEINQRIYELRDQLKDNIRRLDGDGRSIIDLEKKLENIQTEIHKARGR